MVTRVDRLGFAKRLNVACDQKGVPPKGKGRQTAVAKLFDVSQKGARKWLEGEAMPSLWRIRNIALILDVSGEWLLTERPMPQDEMSLQKQGNFHDLETLELATKIQSLSRGDRAHIRAVIDKFVLASNGRKMHSSEHAIEVDRLDQRQLATRRTHRRRRKVTVGS